MTVVVAVVTRSRVVYGDASSPDDDSSSSTFRSSSVFSAASNVYGERTLASVALVTALVAASVGFLAGFCLAKRGSGLKAAALARAKRDGGSGGGGGKDDGSGGGKRGVVFVSTNDLVALDRAALQK